MSSIIYESINKDWFYYKEKHDSIYYIEQRKMCEDFITESRKEQYEILADIEKLKQRIQQKENEYQTLQQRKELIKDRINRLNEEITTVEPMKRPSPF